MAAILPDPSVEATEDALAGLPAGDLLLPYQVRANHLVNSTALAVIEKSRRIGLTWGLAAEAVLQAAASRQAGGQNVLYISYAQDMTRDFIDACGFWAKALYGVAVAEQEVMFPDPAPDDPDRHIQAFRIEFASGFYIMGLSSAPRSLRGKQGLVIIDEAAFVDSLAELMKAAQALMMWGGRVVVVSTHNGADNPFNQLLAEIRAGERAGETMTVTFTDALDAGLFDRIKLVLGDRLEAETREEYEAMTRAFYGTNADEELDCKPPAGGGAWLNVSDIVACEHGEAGLPEHYDGGLTYVGWDVARRRDLSVISPWELMGDVLWLRARIEMSGETFAHMDSEFDRVMKNYRVAEALIDQSGMGEKVVEDAQGRHGEYRVKGKLFTPANKLDMATALKKRFEEQRIRIPKDDAIRADLKSIKRKKGSGAQVLLAEDGSSDGHGDRFWSYALAALAAEIPYQKYDYRPVRAGEERIERPVNTGGAGWRAQRGTY